MKPRILSTARLSFPLASAVAALLAAPFAQAANITWSGATNTWNTNTNWVGSVLPVSNDSLFFDAAGAGGLSLNNNLTSGSFTVVSLVFTSTAGAYVIGDGTATANVGNTFVLGAPASTAAYTSSITNGSGNALTFNTPFSMTAVRNIIGGTNISLAGNISGVAGGIRKSGSNTLTLSGTNTYTGVTQIDIGVLRLDSASAVPGGIGVSGGLSNINLNGGVLGLATGDFTRGLGTGVTQVQFSNGNPGGGGWAAFGANRSVNLGGALASVNWTTAGTGLTSKTLILSHPTATHTVDFQNPLDMLAVARTVQVDEGAAAIDGTISGNITGIASGNLTKTGNGTLLLSGAANNYVGTTSVNVGTLLINGTKSGTGTVTVSNATNFGAALGGTGTINGAVTVSATGRIDLTDGAVGNLSLGSSLTLSGTAASPNLLFFDLGNGAGGTDKIITTGAHTASTANGVQVHLNQLSGGAINPGSYTLIQGGAASTFTGYTLATTRAGRNQYSALGASGNDLQVTVAAGTSGDITDNHYWQGDTSVWNTAQWYSDAAGTLTATAPGYSSNVRFGTTTAANLTNTLGEDYEINSLTVDAGLAATSISGNMLTIDATIDNNNAASNGITVNNVDGTTIASRVGLANSQTWTVGTGAALTVSGVVSDFGIGHSLTKAGAGTLTLSGVNTFSGPLTVSGGTLTIGGAGQLNNGVYGANIVNNATLSYSSSAAQTFNGIISGTGSLTKSGGSTLTLNNSGTFTGGATISGGTVQFGPANLVNPLGSGTTTVNTGGIYALGATTVSAPLVLNGGTVTAGNSFTSWINGPTTLTANSTISVSGNLTVNGNISGVGGLTKTLAAFVSLNGSNTYDGPTIISTGGFTFKSSLYNNDTAKWIPANITVANGASLVMNVGGAGEFTIGQAGLMFSQLGGAVNNNGLLAGSIFGVDLRTAGGSFTISDNLIDSSGPGGGSVGFRIVGNDTIGAATVELTGTNTYSGPTIVDRHGLIKVSSINSVNGGSPPLASSSLGRPTTIANGTIQLGTNVSFRGAGLVYTGNGETTDRVLNMGGGGSENYRLDQSGAGLLKFTSNMTMTDTRGTKNIVLQGSTAGTGEMAGVIPNATSGSGTAITKSGTGTWTLSGANLYLGLTTVTGGSLVLANANALNGGIGATGGLGALTFNGGVIGLGAGNFSRPLAAANTVGAATFTGAGGWAAYGADRTVNLGGASAAIAWTTASTGLNGQTLILSNATATHTVDFQNPLTLGGNRTVQVDNGAAAVDGILSGAVSGLNTLTLTKSGAGTLLISGTADNASLILNASAGTAILGKTPIGASAAVAGISDIATGATVQLSGTGGNQIFNGPFQTQFGLVNMSGGTLDFNGLNEGFDRLTGTGSVTNSLAATTSTLTLGTVGGSGSFGGALTDGSGVLALSKTGAGTLTLTGTNTYSGNTAVSAGTLLINNTAGSGTGSGSVSVATGTLGGNGFITGAVTIGNSAGSADAILAPGNSIDSIDTGNLTFNSDGSYACELDGTLVTSDVTNVTGTVTINSATTLTVSLTGSLVANQKYFIVNNDAADAVTGTFSGLAQDAVVGNYGGINLKISYTGDVGTNAITGGNDIVLYGASSSPYAAWAAGSFTNAFSNTLPGVDFDNDGLSNLLEFVLGGDPTISQAGIAPTVITSGSDLVMTFKRSDASELAPAVSVKVELSTDLTFSTPADDITIGPVTDAGPIAPSGASYIVTNSVGFDTIVLTIPQGAAPKKFARVKAVQP